MGHDGGQVAIVHHFLELGRRQSCELLVGNAPVFRDRNRVLRILRIGNLDVFLLEQVERDQALNEGFGCAGIVFECRHEIDRLLGVVGGLTLLVEEGALRVFGHDEFRIEVDTDRRGLVVRVRRADERIAAHIGRNVVFVIELAFAGHENIRALAQAHHQHRHLALAEEDDRIAAAGKREFRADGRHEMPVLQEGKRIGDSLDAVILVLLPVQRLDILVERNGTRETRLGGGCIGHGTNPFSSLGAR